MTMTTKMPTKMPNENVVVECADTDVYVTVLTVRIEHKWPVLQLSNLDASSLHHIKDVGILTVVKAKRYLNGDKL